MEGESEDSNMDVCEIEEEQENLPPTTSTQTKTSIH
ncbi:unnamed protein product, partial [Rotaria sp. Silwood1]